MYQSSTRKNFLDILLDPTAIAILASIALHATIGATLPFFTKPDKAGIKTGPSTVKVVELTPNELQRIPQAPPTPAPQVLPPVTQPTTAPSPQVTPPSTPEFSTAPQTIPFPSIIGTPQPKKIAPKPKSAPKQPKGTPQKQPTTTIFDPELIFKPTPKPSKSPLPKGVVTPKPSVKPQPIPKPQPITKKPQTPTAPAPQQNNQPTDDDGGGQQQPQPATSAPKPTRQAQPPIETPPNSEPPNSLPKPVTQPPNRVQGNGSGDGYVRAALAKEIEYRNKYPGIQVYAPKEIQQPYPAGTPCPKTRQLPVVVYMVAFDKMPENQNNNVLGNITPDSIDAAAFVNGDTPENRKLIGIAKDAAISAANTADNNRPPVDKGKQVLYRYKVQFTCNP